MEAAIRITLRQLQLFSAIADTGSTAAAAEAVSLSQSATSAALGDLEDLLGVPLFDRVGRRLVLNDHGRTLLPMARALLDDARQIEEHAAGRGPLAGTLRLAASTTIGNHLMPPLLARFRARAPQCRIDLVIGNTREVAEAVEAFTVDLGLIEGPPPVAGLEVIPWIEDELRIVAGAGDPLAALDARGERIGVKALRQAAWLLREPGSGTREEVAQALLPHLRQLDPAMTLGSSEAIKNAVAAGLGISCLPACVVDEAAAAGRLVALRTTLPRLVRRFAIVHHRRKTLSPALQAFVALCREDGSAADA